MVVDGGGGEGEVGVSLGTTTRDRFMTTKKKVF
jgi:hypothetical protein